MLFVSGQIALDPHTGTMVDGDVAAQTHRVLKNVAAILEAGGSSLDRVVRTTVYLADIGDFQKVNAIYGSFFTKDPPARSALQAGALPKMAKVEIDAIAVR